MSARQYRVREDQPQHAQVVVQNVNDNSHFLHLRRGINSLNRTYGKPVIQVVDSQWDRGNRTVTLTLEGNVGAYEHLLKRDAKELGLRYQINSLDAKPLNSVGAHS